MKNRILQTIRTHNMIEKGMHIVVGLSGGPDSMCMFDVLCSMAEEWQLHLYPVHVNHKFRPGAAEEDQAFVERFCASRGWPCRSFVYDCSRMARDLGLTSEEAGRKARYEAFARTAADIAAGGTAKDRIVIAVAQNAEDQAETILFRILRGTGITGLGGIAYKRFDENGTAVIRPLLDCRREEIEDYCTRKNLSPRIDHTNQEPVYARNRIRLELLPYLQTYNPNMVEGLIRLGRAAAEDSGFLQQMAEEAFVQAAEEPPGTAQVNLSAEILKNLHPAIRKRVYHIALDRIGLSDNLSAAHLAGVERVLASASPSASWNLPEGCTAEKQYSRLVLKKKEPQQTGSLCIHKETLQPEGRICSAEFSLEKLQETHGRDAAENIFLRTRQPGDFMVISTGGSLHRKKLQDLLVDMKVPKLQRDHVLLAACGSEILWIVPVQDQNRKLLVRGRSTAAYRVSDLEKESIIVLEYLS